MGQNKALLPLRGRPLIEIAAATMREVFERVCIIADDAAPYGFLGLPVLPDIVKQCGPLGGIHAGLVHSPPGAVFALACDTPLIPPDLIRFLISRRSAANATVARQSDVIQPLCGIYERSALPVIEQSLSRSSYKMLDVLNALDSSCVDITGDLPFYCADLFGNINDPQTFNAIASRRHR